MARTSEIHDLDARMAERRTRGAAIRDLGPGDRREASRLEQPFLSPLGWLITVAANILLVVLIGLSFVVVPPLRACSDQSARGFFAGDTFQACASRGIAARFRDLDGRLRQIILRSGQ